MSLIGLVGRVSKKIKQVDNAQGGMGAGTFIPLGGKPGRYLEHNCSSTGR